MYPPVGPARTLSPPLKPANTGTPTAPTRVNTVRLIVPYFLPRSPPASITASVARFTGTGVNPSGIDIQEHTAAIAAKRPASAIPVVFL